MDGFVVDRLAVCQSAKLDTACEVSSSHTAVTTGEKKSLLDFILAVWFTVFFCLCLRAIEEI
jgi:hypothetical protein